MVHQAWSLLAACAVITSRASLATGAVYVGHSPACSDSGGGTEAAPLCSISAGLAKARGAEKHVVLRAGTFTLTEALRLTAADSGLTLRAADGERVVVSGGTQITGWAESAVKGVWTAPVPASCSCVKGGACGPSSCMAYSSPRQLYVNGRRANRTQANASTLLGWMDVTTTAPPQTPAGIAATGGSYTVQNPALKSFTKGDMEFVYPAQLVPWVEPRCGIKSVSADGLTVHMQDCLSKLPPKPGCAGPTPNSTLCPRRWFMAGLPGLLENVFELLSPKTPGQFFIDRTTAAVHYVPHSSEDMKTAQVVMPLLESVLLSDGAQDLTIMGIDFEHTAWGGADQPCGYVPTQAGWGSRPIDEPHSLGPKPKLAALAPTSVGNMFVIGAGGGAAFLDSKAPGPASMVSQSGTASMGMQGDANLCTMVYASKNCTTNGCAVALHTCLGAPVCPCAPKCVGPSKLPPICNASSPTGYRLVVTGAAGSPNLCVQDTAAKTNRWCALPASGPAAPPSKDYHAMLGDDGSICLHAGKYTAGAADPQASVWCANLGGAGSVAAATTKQIPAGLRFNNTVNTVLSRCSFAHMGGAGLDIYGASQHTTVTGCYAHDISGTAIQFGGISPCPACPTKLPCGVSAGTSGKSCPIALPEPKLDLNLSFYDNVIADVTREYHGCLGVWGGYMRQATFSHNDICRTAYGGISLGWGWAIPWQNTFQRENEISYNHITHWMGVLDDSGATYTLGPHMNSSLHHNYAAHAGEIGIVSGGPTGASEPTRTAN